jgi:excisionase family DNA binding protein
MMSGMDDGDIITAAEAAQHFDIGERRVRRIIARKAIGARQSGGVWLISKQELGLYLSAPSVTLSGVPVPNVEDVA